MYKYIKGTTILSEEHMLSASEIAEKYHLETLDGKPNEELIIFLIDNYMRDHNYKESEYYYVEKDMHIYRVYPCKTIEASMKEFFDFMKKNGLIDDPNPFNVNGINCLYAPNTKYKQQDEDDNKVISLKKYMTSKDKHIDKKNFYKGEQL